MTDAELAARMERFEAALNQMQSSMIHLGDRMEQMESTMAGPPPITSRLRDHDLLGAKSKSAITDIDRRLTGIENNLGWLLKILIGAMLLAVVNFILDGGLLSATVP